MRVAAVLLAAGLGSRFRAADPTLATKLVAEVGGVPLVRGAAEAALASRAGPLLVVTGHAADAVRSALEGLPLALVHNPDYADGMASSLRAGLSALPPDVAGALVLLGDMPGVAAATLDRLVAAFAAAPEAEAVVPVHRGRRGNPALLARALFPAAMALGGDQGARRLLARARVVDVKVADDGVLIDIDEPSALRLTGPEAR